MKIRTFEQLNYHKLTYYEDKIYLADFGNIHTHVVTDFHVGSGPSE